MSGLQRKIKTITYVLVSLLYVLAVVVPGVYFPNKGDLNADGKINLSDLSRVAGSFGSTGSDLIGDTGGGVVNLTDLSIVAGKFGFVYTLL